jgi:hypothetical protein
VQTALENNERVMESKRQAVRDKHARQNAAAETRGVANLEKERREEEERRAKEAKRKAARDSAAAQLAAHIEMTHQKEIDQKRRKAEEEERIRQENMVKEEEEELARLEKLDNVRRIARMDEYRRAQLIARMNSDAERAAAMDAEKFNLLQQRKYSSVQAKMEKERLLTVFQRMRQSGKEITPEVLSKLTSKSEHGTSPAPQTPMAKSASAASLGRSSAKH